MKIATIFVFPSNQPDSNVISLRDEPHPEEYGTEASIEVKPHVNGDYHITYLEDQFGEEWMGRWDCHESEEYSIDHFHSPPNATHDNGMNRDYPPELPSVFSHVVVPWVNDRMRDILDGIRVSEATERLSEQVRLSIEIPE
ncbi:hypothetical protein ACFFQF_19275 [Haladaptatus pallidirubidus]|uniref:hypothetical protein n=1 Tax=Haladaptatus pallidirubidus TaxID=1008152 RepID=UPI0035E855CB